VDIYTQHLVVEVELIELTDGTLFEAVPQMGMERATNNLGGLILTVGSAPI
jgi:hypothetical protein